MNMTFSEFNSATKDVKLIFAEQKCIEEKYMNSGVQRILLSPESGYIIPNSGDILRMGLTFEANSSQLQFDSRCKERLDTQFMNVLKPRINMHYIEADRLRFSNAGKFLRSIQKRGFYVVHDIDELVFNIGKDYENMNGIFSRDIRIKALSKDSYANAVIDIKKMPFAYFGFAYK